LKTPFSTSKEDPKEVLSTPKEEVLSTPKEAPKKKPIGRPKKTKVASKRAGGRGQVGRPKGDAGVMQDYKARMLASPKSRKVLDSIFSAALDDDHKNQSAAWKIITDRILPVGMFEAEVVKDTGKNQVNINITTHGTTKVDTIDSIEEAEFTVVNPEESP